MGKSDKLSIYMYTYLKKITHNTHKIVSYSLCKCQLTSNNKPTEVTNKWMQNTRQAMLILKEQYWLARS